MLLRNSRIKCACANVMTKSLWKGRSLGYETPNSNSKKKKKKIHDPSLPSFKNIGTKQLQSKKINPDFSFLGIIKRGTLMEVIEQ